MPGLDGLLYVLDRAVDRGQRHYNPTGLDEHALTQLAHHLGRTGLVDEHEVDRCAGNAARALIVRHPSDRAAVGKASERPICTVPGLCVVLAVVGKHTGRDQVVAFALDADALRLVEAAHNDLHRRRFCRVVRVSPEACPDNLGEPGRALAKRLITSAVELVAGHP